MGTLLTPRCSRGLLLAALAALVFPSGCATIVNGRYQRIRVDTDPPAAKVTVEGTRRQTQGVVRFETPGEVALHRKEKHAVVRIEKSGYEPVEIALKRGGSGWAPIGILGFAGLGALAGGIEGGVAAGIAGGAVYGGISAGIDLLTGSAFWLHPSRISVTLEMQKEDSAREAAGSPVVSRRE